MFLRGLFMVSAVVWATTSSANDQYASIDMRALTKASSSKVYLATYENVRAPIGWLQFCRQQPQECRDAGAVQEPVTMNATKLQELAQVNIRINKQVEPVTDAEQFGVTERWSYPDTGKGDCEDYVLLKRRELMARGWPASSLLITVVRDLKNEGHAVLTVHTSKGDLVLDNVRDDIRGWKETGYRFVKRQSLTSANLWVSLTDQASPDMAVAAQR